MSGIAIAIAAAAIVCLFSLVSGITSDLEYNLKTFATGAARIQNDEFDEDTMINPLQYSIQDYSAISEILNETEGIASFVPRLNTGANLFAVREGEDSLRDDLSFNTMVMGVEFDKEMEFTDLAGFIVSGTVPERGTDQVLVGAGMADELKLELGDKMSFIFLKKNGRQNGMTLEVTGVVRFPVAGLDNNLIMAPLERIQYYYRVQKADEVTTFMIKNYPDPQPADYVYAMINGESLPDASKHVEAKDLKGTIDSKLQAAGIGGLSINVWTEVNTMYSLLEIAVTAYDFMALVFFLIASTVIINTTIMVIFERMREIGTISAMGMTGGEIVRLFFLEAFFISVAGAFIGVLIGIAVTIPLSYVGLNFADAMQGMDMEISAVMYPRLNLKSTAFVFFYSVTISSLAALVPALRAARIQPVKALRTV